MSSSNDGAKLIGFGGAAASPRVIPPYSPSMFGGGFQKPDLREPDVQAINQELIEAARCGLPIQGVTFVTPTRRDRSVHPFRIT